MPTPISTVFLVMAVTMGICGVAVGVAMAPVVVALVNEAMVTWANRPQGQG